MRTLILFFFLAAPVWCEAPIEQLTALRASRGLDTPVWDEQLAASCAARASVLAAEGELSHLDQGRGPGVQAMAAGLPPGEYGEVLGAGPADEVWKAWLASATHRAVLETAGWVTWGWGKASLGATTVYVARFWKP